MVTVRKYATIFNQSTGSTGETGKAYANWENLNNLKEDTNTYATCQVTSNNQSNNQPATIYATGFDFNIPKGSNITDITVGYAHYKLENKMSIAAPLINILNTNVSAYGESVPSKIAPYTVSRNNNLSIETVNKNNFGVSFHYPTNTSNTGGELCLQYIYIEITYNIPTYLISSTVDNAEPQTNETFLYKINISNTTITTGDYVTNVDIKLPNGIEYVGKNSGNGVVSQIDTNNLVWSLPLTNNVETLILELKPTTNELETYNIIATERTTNTFTITPIVVNQIQYNITSNLPNYIDITTLTENKLTFHIQVSSVSHSSEKIPLKIELPESWKFLTAEGLQIETIDYNNTTGIWNADLSEGKDTIIFTVQVLANGNQTINVTDSKEQKTEIKTTILDSTYTKPYYTYIQLNQETLDLMEDGIKYTATSYMKILERDNSINYYHGTLDYRFGVYQGEIDSNFNINNVNFTSGFDNNNFTRNNYQRQEVDFIYKEGTPVYIFWTGGYLENNPEKADVLFTEPCIIEKQYFKNLSPFGVYPKPLKKILDSIGYAHIEIPANSETSILKLSNIDWQGLKNITSCILEEIQLQFYYATNLPTILIAELEMGNGTTVNRSLSIPAHDGIITIGGQYDLWDLKHEDLTYYDNMSINLIIKNPYFNPVTVDIGNATLQGQYLDDLNLNSKGFSINGDKSQYYGIFLEDLDLGYGINSTVKEHRMDGSDNTLEYLMNMKDKNITLTCYLDDCNIEDSSILLDKFTKLIMNEKTRKNKPIYKQIRFDHIPNKYWNYIAEKEIDVTDENGDYKLKIDLTIPEGCAWSDYEIVSSGNGRVNGLKKISPIIRLKAIQSEITITETISKQSLSIRDYTILQDDIIIINCEKRTVERVINDEKTVDLTSNVDFDSDFFAIMGDYFFDAGTSAIIQTVTYREAL